MNSAICERDAADLLSLYMPRTVWWAIGGTTLAVALFFSIVVLIFVFHARRPHNRRMDSLVERLWRVASLPLLILGLVVMYAVYSTVVYFGTEMQYAMSYYTSMCIYPTAEAVITHETPTL